MVSLVSENLFRSIPVPRRPAPTPAPFLRLSSVANEALNVRGLYELPITIQGRTLHHHFVVVRQLPQSLLLGADFIQQHGLSYDSQANEAFFHHPAVAAVSSWTSGSIINISPVTLAPRASTNLHVQVQTAPGQPLQGPATCLLQPATTKLPLVGDEGVATPSARGLCRMLITNASDQEVFIPANTWLGSATPEYPQNICSIDLNDNDKPESKPPVSSKPTREKLLHLQNSSSFKQASPTIQKLILLNHDIFSLGKHDIGKCDSASHRIYLKDDAPVYRKQFRIPEAHRKVLLEHLTNWLKLKIVSPSTSRYNSPIFCVIKKDGSLRPVLDYRALNSKTHIDKYSARDVQTCLDELGRTQSSIFSTLDLTAGFWQLPLHPSSRSFTAFSIPGYGSFEWLRTPMGLLGSPASFGRLMDFVMRHLSNVICYQDDVLVHSPSMASHTSHLQECFDRLRAHNLRLNIAKCQFGQEEVPYLGFRITKTGVLPGIDKTSAILNASPPTSIRQVREFTGLCNYFRASIPNYAFISQRLTALLKKDSSWKDGQPLPADARAAFLKLQSILARPPVLAYPDPSKTYYLHTDASAGSGNMPGGLGACLIQFYDDVPRPIAYASRSLLKHEKNYSAYLLELQGCIWAIQHFDVYLRDRHFHLFCDHKPLEKLGAVHTKTLNRLQQLMLEYNFTISHNPGKLNNVADFLSRNPVSAVDISFDSFLAAQEADNVVATLKSQLESDSSLQLRNGLLFKNVGGTYRVVVPASLQPTLLQAAHNSLLGGHMGIFKTAKRILSNYYWPNMHKDIADHVRNCAECLRVRTQDHPHKQPLKPLPQPANINHRVHIDLFGPLANSERKNNFILVMTDAFSKMCELVAIPNKEAKTVADALFDTWICRYGTPYEIVTDNGKEFCNQISNKLFSRLQILHSTTTPYHPQSNSQVETFNRTIKRYLRTFLEQPYLDWEPYLPAIRICYNTSVSKAIQTSPFSLMFGINPRMPFFELDKYIDYDETKHNVDQLTRLFSARQLARQNNLEYKTEYKKQYDRALSTNEMNVEEGDYVLLSTIPSQKFQNKKLHPAYIGPFPVVSSSSHTATLNKDGKHIKVNKDRLKRVSAPATDHNVPPPSPTPAPHISDDFHGHIFAEASTPSEHSIPDQPGTPQHDDSSSDTSDFHGFHTPTTSPGAPSPPAAAAPAEPTVNPTGTRPKQRKHSVRRGALVDDILDAFLPRRSTRHSAPGPDIPPLPDKPPEYKTRKRNKR